MLSRFVAIGVLAICGDAAAEPELGKWLAAHGAKGDTDGDSLNCVELKVGDKGEAALACDRGQGVGSPGAFLLVERMIYVVRGGKVEKVLDVPIDLFNLDSGWRACSKPLVVRVARDAVTVEPGKACAEKDPIADEARHINAAPGVYRWRGGRFQR